MKKYTLGVLLAAIALTGVSISAIAQKREFPKPPVYVNPTAPEMPVIASSAFFDTAMLKSERFLELREAGFNMSRQSMSQIRADLALKAIEGTGVKMMLYCWEALDPKRTVSVINKYKNNPNIGAYFVFDEPKASKFEYVKELNDLFRRADSSKLTHINIYPTMDSKTLEAPDYRTYVEEFVSIVNPTFLCFDHYAINVNDGKLVCTPRYFENLEIISDVAKKSERPFYSYVLCNKFDKHPIPDRANLRFQIFSVLGYGAQGLNYFTYCPPDFDKDNEFTYTPLDHDGNRTSVWYALKDVNAEVHNLEKYFLGADFITVEHTGKNIPIGTRYLNSPLPAPFTALTSNGEGVMVSHFKNKGKDYLFILNRDLNKKQKVNFTKTAPVVRITGDGKRKTDNSKSVVLPPCGYALYEL